MHAMDKAMYVILIPAQATLLQLRQAPTKLHCQENFLHPKWGTSGRKGDTQGKCHASIQQSRPSCSSPLLMTKARA